MGALCVPVVSVILRKVGPSVLFVGLLLMGAVFAPGAAAGHTRVEILPYDFALPVPVTPECDDRGRFAVRFCDALEQDYDRVSIQVWPGLLPFVPVAAKYSFQSSTGAVVGEGVFCGQVNTAVPPEAASLVVDVGSAEALAFSQEIRACVASPFNGEVWIRWSHSGALVDGDPEEPCD